MLTSGPLYVVDDAADQGTSAAGDALEEQFSFPGLVAWAICAVGLTVAMFSLVTGRMWLAMAGLGFAVTGPSLGLAWLSHLQRGAYNVAFPSRD